MHRLIPVPMCTLCRIDDIPENGAKGFPNEDGSLPGLFAVRQGDTVFVYENACPHIGTPLDWVPNRFFSRDGQHLICATHGALFTVATGECVSGPCRGDSLTAVETELRDGFVLIPARD